MARKYTPILRTPFAQHRPQSRMWFGFNELALRGRTGKTDWVCAYARASAYESIFRTIKFVEFALLKTAAINPGCNPDPTMNHETRERARKEDGRSGGGLISYK